MIHEQTCRIVVGPVLLAGTLTVADDDRRGPAVVLVSGTGPIDRDVTFAGHRLFHRLAMRLASAGISSLRFDKRGVGESEGEFAPAGPEDFVADVRAVWEHLCSREGFSRPRTGLIGHSEGGMVALGAAAAQPDMPFCVLMASPFLSGLDNMARSFALMAASRLERDAAFEDHVTDLTELVRIARTDPGRVREPRIEAAANQLASLIFSPRTALILGATELSGRGFLDLLSSSCLDTCLAWDPPRVVPLVSGPALVLFGGMDVQVPAVENAAAARDLIERLGREDWEVREYPGLNHAFQRCVTGMPDEYSTLDPVMADAVIADVAAWIHATA